MDFINRGEPEEEFQQQAEPNRRNSGELSGVELKNNLQLLSRASFFVHGLPRSHIPLTGQAPRRANHTEKHLVIFITINFFLMPKNNFKCSVFRCNFLSDLSSYNIYYLDRYGLRKFPLKTIH